MPYFSGNKKYPKVCSPCRKVVEDQAKLALESEPEPAENERPQGVGPLESVGWVLRVAVCERRATAFRGECGRDGASQDTWCAVCRAKAIIEKSIAVPPLNRCDFCPFEDGCVPGRCVVEDVKSEAPAQQRDTALKFDESKLPYHLMPLEAEAAIVRVLAFGAAKYKVENWREGFTWSRLYDAIRRHLAAFWAGEDLDPDDGEHHLAHLLCTAAFLYVHAKQGIGTDDRLGVDGGVTEMFDVSDVVAKGHAARRDK